MRLIYTDISQQLTSILSQEAQKLVEQGKRVFYIAPNSLSFEKERQVLELLPQQATFDIIVTRFAQMARYLTLNTTEAGETLDDIGLTMLFYRVLNRIEDDELKVYGRLRQNMDFIKQLVDLYQELQKANLTIIDLDGLDSAEKLADLHRIFTDFDALMALEAYDNRSKLGLLTQQISSGQLDWELDNLAIVIDGFTRFSVEESNLVASLEAKGVPIIIGTYATTKAYQATYITGNLYQAGVDFLRELAVTYATTPEYRTALAPAKSEGLAKISEKMANRYDFSEDTIELTESDRDAITIWEVVSQKEEVHHVAKQIRHYLAQGYRYKDILVLLGDVDAYRLQIGKIFDQYEIPYYLGKAESMAQHPLVAFIDALLRIKRYRFQTDDVANLLKTGLYGQLSQTELDKFVQYISYAQIKGASRFGRDFTLNQGLKFDLAILNQWRKQLLASLITFLQAKAQSGRSFLQKLTDLLEGGQLMSNLANLVKEGGQQEEEKAEQAWSLFTRILQECNQIFGQEKLTVEEFLSLIRAGMVGSNFRMVPATVDVVNVKSYDLITPQANKLVFAIGLTQGNFPKLSKNTSLLSDEERLAINEKAGETRLEVNRHEQGKRNHFAALSLINAATDHLVLSTPQLLKDNEETMSPYLADLLALGIPKKEKGRASLEASVADIGNYKALLSTLVEINRQAIEDELDSEKQTFWSAVARYLRQKLAREGLSIPQISPDLHSQPLAPETLSALYPVNQPLRLSASSLSDFYNSEYKYFLRYVLGLQELQTVAPDARIHGTFLHKVFEHVLQDERATAFDKKVSQAIQQVSQAPEFEPIYTDNPENQFAHLLLADIAQSTARVLRDDQLVKTVGEETGFQQTLTLENNRSLQIVGKIDRIDQLKSNDAKGVIDYKSSQQTFQLSRFYNGLSPQLMTYLFAISSQTDHSLSDKIFGAMYLHMTDPIIPLNKVKHVDDIPKESQASLQYRGLFLEEHSQDLTVQYAKTKSNTFTAEEYDKLLGHIRYLYQAAARRILAGHFAINPYTADGRSVSGDQYNSITHFEADLHLSQARFLAKLGRKKEDWLNQMQKGGQD